MIVLVVGGAGYIGSHTARALRRAGHEVIVFDDLSTGYERLASGFELIRADVLDHEAGQACGLLAAEPFHHRGQSGTDERRQRSHVRSSFWVFEESHGK